MFQSFYSFLLLFQFHHSELIKIALLLVISFPLCIFLFFNISFTELLLFNKRLLSHLRFIHIYILLNFVSQKSVPWILQIRSQIWLIIISLISIVQKFIYIFKLIGCVTSNRVITSIIQSFIYLSFQSDPMLILIHCSPIKFKFLKIKVLKLKILSLYIK